MEWRKDPANADDMNCFRFATTPAYIRGSAPALLLRATSSLQMRLQHSCILLQHAEASRKQHKGRQPSHFANAQLDKLCSLGYDMPNYNALAESSLPLTLAVVMVAYVFQKCSAYNV